MAPYCTGFVLADYREFWFNMVSAALPAARFPRGVRIDGGGSDHLADRRELVTHVDQPHPERLPNLLHDLQIRGTADRPSSWRTSSTPAR
jgi:hypothetical protein